MNNIEGEMEKRLRELGEAKARLWNTFLETSLGKFVICCVEFLNGMLNKR